MLSLMTACLVIYVTSVWRSLSVLDGVSTMYPQVLSYKSFFKAFIFCQIGYISGIIYYLINGQKSLSRSETSLPYWKTDSSSMSYWKAEIVWDDGNAKWHLPLTSGKWRGLTWANELQNEYMFKPHLKWHLWHCHANLGGIQSAGINSLKLWLDLWRDQFVSKCVQAGLFVIMIRYLYLFLSFSCILNSISTQISLSYQVFEGRLEHNTAYHCERQG